MLFDCSCRFVEYLIYVGRAAVVDLWRPTGSDDVAVVAVWRVTGSDGVAVVAVWRATGSDGVACHRLWWCGVPHAVVVWLW